MFFRRSIRSWVSGSCCRSSASFASALSSAARAWWKGSRRMSSIHASASTWRRRVTRSLRAGGAHHGARSATTSVNVSSFSLSQRCASSSVRSTRPWCAPSRTTSSSRLPATGLTGSSSSRGSSASWMIAAMSSSRTRDRPSWSTEADLVADAAGVALVAEPRADSAAQLGGVEPLTDHGFLQEVLADELLEAATQHLLALRDQRGVRDRQPQRVLEDAPSPRTSRRWLRPSTPLRRRSRTRETRPGRGSARRPRPRRPAATPQACASGEALAVAAGRAPGSG